MKNPIAAFFIAVSVFACKDDPNQQKSGTSYSEEGPATEMPSENDPMYRDTSENGNTASKKPTEPDILIGKFIRVDDDKGATSCQCNCVDINFTHPTSLCIDSKSGLAIQASFKRAPDGSLNIYYTKAPQSKGKKGIPWNKFDTAVPIATIAYDSNNTFQLDWKGFTIGGEIAVDYAIYGKKNLEGNYRKL